MSRVQNCRLYIPLTDMIDLGIALRGFLASSPEVAITSKPLNAKNNVDAPERIPFKPNGAKFFQFFVSAYVNPEIITKTSTLMLRIVKNQFNAFD